MLKAESTYITKLNKKSYSKISDIIILVFNG